MDKELTLVEHLEELRRRIIISLASVFAVSFLAMPFAPRLLAILKYPGAGLIEKLVFFNPSEAFLINIKLSFFTGFVASAPLILYQLWAFVSPAVGERIKRRGLGFIFFSASAFILGASFGFFILVPAALKFLLGFSSMSLEPLISVSSYVSFVVGLVLGSGFVFEMPILSFLLSKLGVINHRFLRRAWKYAVVIIFIIAALITPTGDIFNMIILAVPMLLLYEISIWVSRFAARGNRGT